VIKMFDKLGREEQVEHAYEAGFDEGYDEARTDAINALKEYQKDIYDTVMGTVNNDTINQCITLVEWNTKDGL
tara:strand:+ start:345 stop:563 length:219 start_codon:yes stop_codon:yes gene_type:complete